MRSDEMDYTILGGLGSGWDKSEAFSGFRPPPEVPVFSWPRGQTSMVKVLANGGSQGWEGEHDLNDRL